MISAGFLLLQALLVVATGSFGGGSKECFGEGYWRRWYGLEADSKRFVAKGRGGMCLAVYGGRGVDYGKAWIACNVGFVGGRLLSNDSWYAFVKALDNYKDLLEFNKTKTMYVGFSPQSETKCYMIDEYLNATSEYPCEMNQMGFVCEYPRQEFCRWEVTMGDTPVRDSDGKWELKKELVLLQEVDGSEKSCEPFFVEDYFVGDWVGACRPLFNETWSQWSVCGGYCGNEQRQQSRIQAPSDRCKYATGSLERVNERSCFQMPCSTDATTESGVTVISISHLPMLFVFLSMFSH